MNENSTLCKELDRRKVSDDIRLRVLTLFLIFLFQTGENFAQPGSLRGHVRDAKTHEAVPFATVFLANTTFGIIATDGNYFFQNIPSGKYNLTVSCVGYKLASIPVLIKDSEQRLDIQLEQQTTLLKEVVVSARRSDYARLVRMFKKYFLGETLNASKCIIKNIKDVYLKYDKKSKVLTASASVPIEIENQALGYRVLYLLDKFRLDLKNNIIILEGIVRFQNLTPKNAYQLRQWIKERNRAYYGSLNHFMRSLKFSCLSEDDFSIYLMRKSPHAVMLPDEEPTRKFDTLFALRKINESDLFSEKPDASIQLEIVYYGENQEFGYNYANRNFVPQTSYLKFVRDALVIHDNGYHENPLSFYVEGYLAWSEKVAELLPLEYLPITKPKN